MNRTPLLLAALSLLLGGCGLSASPPAAIPAPPAPTAIPATATVQPISAASIAYNDLPLLVQHDPTPTAPAPAALPDTAAITTLEAAAPDGWPASPTRLVIEDIGLDRTLVAVGLDEQNIPIVPHHDVGWYQLSARPGQGDNIVLWGHVLRFRHAPEIPAPFAHIHKLQPGAQITLYNEVGAAYSYTVTRQVQVTPDQVEYILPKGRERLTLVSCIGDIVVNNGVVNMTRRLIIIAEPSS